MTFSDLQNIFAAEFYCFALFCIEQDAEMSFSLFASNPLNEFLIKIINQDHRHTQRTQAVDISKILSSILFDIFIGIRLQRTFQDHRCWDDLEHETFHLRIMFPIAGTSPAAMINYFLVE